ncbi:MAG: MinD/ParA family protein [bacterium]|nr:MinD/ParA family protein [bacterium]
MNHILKKAQIVTVSGGKGGIGKTFFTINFALELKNRGFRVLIFDADLNLSNASILLGIDDNKNFKYFLEERIPISDVIQKGVGGIDVLYAGNDPGDVMTVRNKEYSVIARGLAQVQEFYDFIIVDTQAGLNMFNLKLMLDTSQQVFFVTNPEVTALVDLYKVIKAASFKRPGRTFNIVINRAASAKQAVDIYSKISDAVYRFNIKSNLEFMGYILDDHKRVLESIQKRTPILLLHKEGTIKSCFSLVANNFLKKSRIKTKKNLVYALINK